MASPIQVSGVALPGDTMDPDAIEGAATNLSTTGSKVSATGNTVYTDWQGLSGVYHAPEQERLFNSVTPAKRAAERFGTEMGTAATALKTFAGEVRTIKAAVAAIKADALAFLGTIHGGQITRPITGPETRFATSATKDVAWDSDQGAVDANNALIHRMNDQQEALWRAERTCANALNAICGHAPIQAADPQHPNAGGYGYDDLPDNAQLPWGQSVERKEDCATRAVKGFFVDGAWNGMVQGLTSLVGFSWTGPDGIGFSWSTMGHAWLGVAHLVTMPGPLTMLLMPVLPKPIRDWENESEKTGVQMLAGMVGIDPYAKDPLAAWHQDAARTGGATAFNIFSFLVPETKAGTAGKAGRAGEAGEVAAKASRASRVLSLPTDGVSWLKGVTLDGLSKISTKFGVDLTKAFKFNDDATIPRVGRDELDTSHSNVGGHDHTDAPPARDGDRAGTHPATPAHPGAHPNVGADPGGAHPGQGGDRTPTHGSRSEPQLPKGQEVQPWEKRADQQPISTSGLQRIGGGHEMPKFQTKTSNEIGRIGEQLTEAELKRQGWEVIFHGRQVEMPGQAGRYFVPDFIVRDPATGQVIAIESKMGSGAHFTGGQLVGYDKLAKGDPLLARSAAMQDVLDEWKIKAVDGVQVYRWGTEFIPDADLIKAAGLSGRVIP